MCHKADEMVSHYLTTCVVFATQRGRMERYLQRATKSVSILLTNTKAFPCLFRYIHNMRRFRGSTNDS